MNTVGMFQKCIKLFIALCPLMGTKMASSYANIFMGDLEERLLLSSLRQPISWFRFIDDVDTKWTQGDKELDAFLEHANSIQFWFP
jgi:hypothetical protein